jgi:hypothetical protein
MYIGARTVDHSGVPPHARKQAMSEITAEQLSQHLDQVETSTQDDKDELLRDLLVHVYPTKVTQDC